MEGGGLASFMPLILIFLVAYLFMIRPQMKRQKQEREFIDKLKVGDSVVTKSGMHGKVKELFDDGTCIIETNAGRIKFERSSISMELSTKDSKAAKSKK